MVRPESGRGAARQGRGCLVGMSSKATSALSYGCRIAEGYEMACRVAVKRLEEIATTFEFSKENTEPLVRTCMTTLSSKM